MLLNAANNPMFKATYIYFAMAGLLAITTVVVKIGMKDVVADKRKA